MADRFLRVLATVSILLPALFMIASPTAAENYSPPTRDGFPNRVFWGDTHVHSNLSPDAFSGRRKSQISATRRSRKSRRLTDPSTEISRCMR